MLVNSNAMKSREVHQCESPNFDVCASFEELGQRPWLGSSVSAVSVHAIDDEQGFSFGQKLPALVRFIGKIDDGPVSDNTQEACQSSFDDEDP
jgi:hypothetical protein